jgi:hypothetical protein
MFMEQRITTSVERGLTTWCRARSRQLLIVDRNWLNKHEKQTLFQAISFALEQSGA